MIDLLWISNELKFKVWKNVMKESGDHRLRDEGEELRSDRRERQFNLEIYLEAKNFNVKKKCRHTGIFYTHNISLRILSANCCGWKIILWIHILFFKFVWREKKEKKKYQRLKLTSLKIFRYIISTGTVGYVKNGTRRRSSVETFWKI